MEQQRIRQALPGMGIPMREKEGGAKELGISLATLYRRLNQSSPPGK